MVQEVDMDMPMGVETGSQFFSSSQGHFSRRSAGCEVAIYLRNGSIWVGHFADSHGDLNFGDDRSDAAHGLGDLLDAEVLKTKHTCSSS
jgi:hypothetical protein